jgi:hypothetical protein
MEILLIPGGGILDFHRNGQTLRADHQVYFGNRTFLPEGKSDRPFPVGRPFEEIADNYSIVTGYGLLSLRRYDTESLFFCRLDGVVTLL